MTNSEIHQQPAATRGTSAHALLRSLDAIPSERTINMSPLTELFHERICHDTPWATRRSRF